MKFIYPRDTEELRSSLRRVRASNVELEFGVFVFVVFVEGGKPENPEKTLGGKQGREPTTNSTHVWHRAGIEPGPHWWEASALATAPPLLLIKGIKEKGRLGRD